MRAGRLEQCFPGLHAEPYAITSPEDWSYNCIAWAAGDTTQWWWPGGPGGYYWPLPWHRGPPTLDDMVRAFEHLGFRRARNARVEAHIERIAIYVNAATGEATHAARQLPNGTWTSKLGKLEDITHETLHGIEGLGRADDYGTAAQIMKRRLPGAPPLSIMERLRNLILRGVET